jgi:O-antigen ligase
MGFLLTVFYFLLSYLTPVGVFGWSVQPLRLELLVAITLLPICMARLPCSFLLSAPQFGSVIAVALLVFWSTMANSLWVGGATHSFLEFIPWAFSYVLVCLFVDSVRRLKLVALLLIGICIWVLAHGAIDLLRGLPESGPPISPFTGSVDVRLWNSLHPFLYVERASTAGWIYRIRAPLGEINDPNDFAQLMLCALPLVFLFWRKKAWIRNAVFTLLPAGALIFGIYLTHSRGALIGLVAITVVATHRRLGTIPAILLAMGLFAAAMATGFTGGRQISIASGSDRTALWSQGLTLVKEHPFFGVGYEQFAENVGHTAHNSIVVCVAEIGILGFYFWCAFLFTSLRNVMILSSRRRLCEPTEDTRANSPRLRLDRANEPLDKALVNRVAFLLLLSLTGFLVAGCFLSRAFVMTFFVLGGLIDVLYEMARAHGMVSPRLTLSRTMIYSIGTMVCLLSSVYLILRVINIVD